MDANHGVAVVRLSRPCEQRGSGSRHDIQIPHRNISRSAFNDAAILATRHGGARRGLGEFQNVS